MALYQLYKVREDNQVVKSGELSTNFRRLKTRLSKMRRGWIMNLYTNRADAMRGFSKQAQDVSRLFGVEVL